MDKQNAIEVRNMSKRFKVDYDKAHTLKDKLLFWKKSHVEVHEVLKNINLDIKKGETVAEWFGEIDFVKANDKNYFSQ